MGIIKSDKTEAILGAQFSIVKEYLEKISTRYELDNYGKWHIDHIIPLAKAKIKTN
ncbi:MAG: hypothetical protein IPJ03_16135 [Ignavibacteriales bacterium]|nr:hypothetical protein [Ignavibacteriales bacterium]